MKLGLMNKGDKVLFVNDRFVAIQRKNGEVDLITFFFNDNGIPCVDTQNITTITYGTNMAEINVKTDDGGEITISTF